MLVIKESGIEIFDKGFNIREQLEEISDLNILERIIRSLDQIEKETQKEYRLVRIQEHLRSYYLFIPKSYDPKGPVTYIIGDYERRNIERIRMRLLAN